MVFREKKTKQVCRPRGVDESAPVPSPTSHRWSTLNWADCWYDVVAGLFDLPAAIPRTFTMFHSVHPFSFLALRRGLSQAPRAKVAQIMKYVKRQIDELDVREGRWFTGIGVVCFVFGALLLILRVAIGSIIPQPPSRKDLSRRQLFK